MGDRTRGMPLARNCAASASRLSDNRCAGGAEPSRIVCEFQVVRPARCDCLRRGVGPQFNPGSCLRGSLPVQGWRDTTLRRVWRHFTSGYSGNRATATRLSGAAPLYLAPGRTLHRRRDSRITDEAVHMVLAPPAIGASTFSPSWRANLSTLRTDHSSAGPLADVCRPSALRQADYFLSLAGSKHCPLTSAFRPRHQWPWAFRYWKTCGICGPVSINGMLLPDS